MGVMRALGYIAGYFLGLTLRAALTVADLLAARTELAGDDLEGQSRDSMEWRSCPVNAEPHWCRDPAVRAGLGYTLDDFSLWEKEIAA